MKGVCAGVVAVKESSKTTRTASVEGKRKRSAPVDSKIRRHKDRPASDREWMPIEELESTGKWRPWPSCGRGG